MKKINPIKKLLIALTIFFLGIFISCSVDQTIYFRPNTVSVGVWWWHEDLTDEYFDFAVLNGVTEIDWGGSTSKLTELSSPFIEKAKTKNIKVYLLLGTYEWINDDSDFYKFMEKYISYQVSSSENKRFAGVHLDVEPHQDPLWKNSEKRSELLQKYLNFIINTKKNYPDINFDFDIPAWFNDQVFYKGIQIELYKAVIQEANRVFIMSYRDSAEAMINFSTVKKQIEYAKSLNKQIFLSAECSSPDEEGTVISYANKGKSLMYDELNKLKGLSENPNLGISIHHIKTWYNLKN